MAESLLVLEDALAQMQQSLPSAVDTEWCSLQALCGRVLAEDLLAPVSVPPFDNSAVDGYAVHGDALTARSIPLSQRIQAGQSPQPLAEGSAARIFTGARIPPGTATVVMQEDCHEEAGQVQVTPPLAAGRNIRPAGQDIAAGEQVFSAGTRMDAAHVGVLASLGLTGARVHRRLRISILATGDELVAPGEPLQDGQIYNSNQPLLAALLQQSGFAIVSMETVADDPDATREALQRAALHSDCIISSGGVSVGEADHLREQVAALGQLSLWRLCIKPGKPLAYGHVAQVPYFGLPGNPAAVFVTYLIVALPLLRQLSGVQRQALVPWQFPAAFEVDRPGKRREFMRVRRVVQDGTTVLTPWPNQSSGVLVASAWASGLAVIPENTCIERGDPVAYLPLAELMGVPC